MIINEAFAVYLYNQTDVILEIKTFSPSNETRFIEDLKTLQEYIQLVHESNSKLYINV